MPKVTKVRSHIRRTKSGKETVVREHTRRVKSRIPESVFRRKVEELRDKINECASIIKMVNADNIDPIHFEGDALYIGPVSYSSSSYPEVKFTDFSKRVLKEYGITLYDSYLGGFSEYSFIKKIAKAKNEKEFLDALEKYANNLESWMHSELDSAYYLAKILFENFDPDKKNSIYEFSFNLFHHGRFVGKVRVEVEERVYTIGNKKYRVYVVRVYHPKYGYSCIPTQDKGFVDNFIKYVNKLIEKLNKEVIDGYDVLNEIYEWIGIHLPNDCG